MQEYAKEPISRRDLLKGAVAISSLYALSPSEALGQDKQNRSNGSKYKLHGIWQLPHAPLRIEEGDDGFVGYLMEPVGHNPKGHRLIGGSLRGEKLYCTYYYPRHGTVDHQSKLSSDGNSFDCRHAKDIMNVRRVVDPTEEKRLLEQLRQDLDPKEYRAFVEKMQRAQ